MLLTAAKIVTQTARPDAKLSQKQPTEPGL